MDDLISRQAAIDLLEKWSGGYDYIETEKESAIKEFQKLPSAQPERKTGKWVDAEKAPFGMWFATCSECGKRQTLEYLNYCPNCGANMEVQA